MISLFDDPRVKACLREAMEYRILAGRDPSEDQIRRLMIRHGLLLSPPTGACAAERDEPHHSVDAIAILAGRL